LNALRAFEAAARSLSFTLGAQALGVSQSAISRHVTVLEALIGTPLFDRRRQGLALTKAGTALLPAVGKSFDRMELALNTIIGDQPGARVMRVHIPPSFAQALAMPMLRDLRTEYPDMALDITTPGQVGPPAQDVDAAIVFTRPVASTLVSDLLWMAQVVPVCHPAVAQAGLAVASDLAGFLARSELLHVRFENQRRDLIWGEYVRRAGLAVETDRGLTFDTAVLAGQYAMLGEGVALLDTRLFARELAEGTLVAPFPAASAEDGYGYFLTIHPEDLADPAVSLFRDWIIRRFAPIHSNGEQ
jgi:LysR family glycine cleavage system transcriptional activator